MKVKKKNDIDKVEKIKRLQELTVSDEEIKQILELEFDVQDVLRDWERQQDILTAEQAAEMIKKALEGQIRGSWDIQKIRRLRRNGILKSMDETVSKKDGFRFHRHDIEKFIEDQLCSREKLIEKRDEYLDQLVEQYETFSKLEQNMKNEITKLKKENERLQNLVQDTESESPISSK